MQGEDGRGLRVEQSALGHQIPARGDDLLPRLEDEAYRAPQLRLQPAQDHGRAQEHRRVPIVAAGVHSSGALGLVGQAGLLLQGQRVHVGPHGDVRAGLGTLEQRDHIRAQERRTRLQTQLLQGALDQGRRLVLLERQLGLPVQPVPDAGNLGQYLRHQFGQTPVEIL